MNRVGPTGTTLVYFVNWIGGEVDSKIESTGLKEFFFKLSLSLTPDVNMINTSEVEVHLLVYFLNIERIVRKIRNRSDKKVRLER